MAEHSRYFDIVKRYYCELKIYSITDVTTFVAKGKITEAEFKEITGEDYIPINNL